MSTSSGLSFFMSFFSVVVFPCACHNVISCHHSQKLLLKIKRNICSTPPQLIGVYWCKQYVSVWFPLIFLENNPFNVAAAASWLWFCHVLDGPRWISERLWCHSIIHAVLWCAKRHGKRRQGGPGSLQKREGLAAQVGCPDQWVRHLGYVGIKWDQFI